MKYTLILFFIISASGAMERPIGQLINVYDAKNGETISHDSKFESQEIVAVNTQGKWVYGWVQSPPDHTNGIWLGVVNWLSKIGDTYGGQAKNFKHAVKKLPQLDRAKVSKTA